MYDESIRIETGMRSEAFAPNTPGAEGIALAAGAPPLAKPFAEPAARRLARRSRPARTSSGGSNEKKQRNHGS
jgi:hypothetical protein